MKICRSFISVKLLLICVLVQTEIKALALTSPPTCGLECIIYSVSDSPCSLTNATCICTNQELMDKIAMCVNANCTIREQLTTEKYSKESCGVPVVDRTKIVSVVGVTGGALALLAFALRILAKLRGASGEPGLDDLCLLGTVLASVPFTALAPVLANQGLGLDIWEVPFNNITNILYIYFWDELIYVTILPLTKISILFFYLRVFSSKPFRKIVYVVIAFNAAFGFVFIIISIFQCRPIEGAWTRWDGTFQGTCNNVNMQGWVNAAINILLDFVTLLLPLPLLSKLGLSRRKKLQIFSMFSVGFFVTIVSIIRLRTLVQFANSTNPTQDYVILGYWSTAEVHVGIICACVPAIRQLLRPTFPTALGSTNIDSMPTSARATDLRRVSSKVFPETTQVFRSSTLPLGVNDHSSVHALVDLENRLAYDVEGYGIAY